MRTLRLCHENSTLVLHTCQLPWIAAVFAGAVQALLCRSCLGYSVLRTTEMITLAFFTASRVIRPGVAHTRRHRADDGGIIACSANQRSQFGDPRIHQDFLLPTGQTQSVFPGDANKPNSAQYHHSSVMGYIVTSNGSCPTSTLLLQVISTGEYLHQKGPMHILLRHVTYGLFARYITHPTYADGGFQHGMTSQILGWG